MTIGCCACATDTIATAATIAANRISFMLAPPEDGKPAALCESAAGFLSAPVRAAARVACVACKSDTGRGAKRHPRR
jgi:hypothetical protein